MAPKFDNRLENLRKQYASNQQKAGAHFNRGDHVTTPDGKGVVLMPQTPGWDRLTVLVSNSKTLPFQRDYYANQLEERE